MPGDVLVLTKPLGTQVAVAVHQWLDIVSCPCLCWGAGELNRVFRVVVVLLEGLKGRAFIYMSGRVSF